MESPTLTIIVGNWHSTEYQSPVFGSLISRPPEPSCMRRVRVPKSVCSAMRVLVSSVTWEAGTAR